MPALRLVHITDLHLDGDAAIALLQQRLQDIVNQYKPDAFVVSGDIVKQDPSNWESIGPAYKRMWAYMETPVFHCPGNHDLARPDGTYDLESYQEYCGPLEYARPLKGFVLVSLNVICNQDEAAKQQRAEDLKHFGGNEQWPDAATPSKAALERIKQNVGNKHIIFIQHLVPNLGDLIRYNQHGVKAVFSGHWHASKLQHYGDCASYNGHNPLFGGIDGTPASFAIVDFRNNGSSKSRWVPVSNNRRYPQVKRSDHVWMTELDGTIERADVVVHDELGYISSFYRDHHKHNVYALDLATGKIKWHRHCEQAIRRSLVSTERMLVGNGYDGKVFAYDLKTGTDLWQASVGNGVDRFLNSSPIVDKRGHILSGNSHTCIAIDASDGRVVWSKRLSTEFAASTCQLLYNEAADSLLIPHISAHHVLQLHATQQRHGRHIILSAETGDAQFVHEPGVLEIFAASPCLEQGIIYSQNKHIQASRFGSNEVLWQVPNHGLPDGSLHMCTFGLFVPGADGQVRMLDPQSGAERWSLTLDPCDRYCGLYSYESLATSSPIVEHEGALYFSALDGYVYKVLGHNGEVVKKVPLGMASLSKPAIVGPGVICADFLGRVHCLKHF